MAVSTSELTWNIKRLIRDAFPQGLPLGELEFQYQKYFQCQEFPSPASIEPGCTNTNWIDVFRRTEEFRRWFWVDNSSTLKIHTHQEPERDLQAYFRLVCYRRYLATKEGAAELPESEAESDIEADLDLVAVSATAEPDELRDLDGTLRSESEGDDDFVESFHPEPAAPKQPKLNQVVAKKLPASWTPLASLQRRAETKTEIDACAVPTGFGVYQQETATAGLLDSQSSSSSARLHSPRTLPSETAKLLATIRHLAIRKSNWPRRN